MKFDPFAKRPLEWSPEELAEVLEALDKGELELYMPSRVNNQWYGQAAVDHVAKQIADEEDSRILDILFDLEKDING